MRQTPPSAPARDASSNVFEIEATDDVILPLSVDALDVRGRTVRLGPSIDAMLKRHDYPPAVSRLVAQAVALAALLGSSMKFEGKFILQTNTDGPVDMIVADFATPNHLRGYARFDAERLAAMPDAKPADLIGKGYLALTVDQGEHMQRYQGIVPLEDGDLTRAAHAYFEQSEQIPTRVKLAVAEAVTRDAGAQWRVGGILVQHLPPEGGTPRDLDPGDGSIDRRDEDPAWGEAVAFIETVEDHELVDPDLASERLLFRLFHERGVHVYDAKPVIDRCHCSGERLKAAIKGLPEDEKSEIAEDGRIEAGCQFCGTVYTFTPEEIAA